jgi:hypothetical protein
MALVHIPDEEHSRLQEAAHSVGLDVDDFIRRSLELGMIATELESNEKGAVVVQKNGEEAVRISMRTRPKLVRD